MRNIAVKVDNVGDTLAAGDFNALNGELENIVNSADFTLDPAGGPDTDTNMLGQTAAAYGSAAFVVADSGSANAYVLARVASSNLKTTPKYFDGQVFVFEAGNTNSGASTVNGFGVGVKAIVLRGSALVGGEIIAGEKIIVIYDQANDRFDLLPTGEATEQTGFVKSWPLATAPSAYLECDGGAVSRTTYSDLFAVIGTLYGVGDGSTTFDLPDYRGEFLRGWDHGVGRDPDAASRTDRGDGTTGDNNGTKQGSQFLVHSHNVKAALGTGVLVDANGTGASVAGTAGSFGGASTNLTVETVDQGGNETRPRNVNTMWVIKF